jgi:hypothetical protein
MHLVLQLSSRSRAEEPSRREEIRLSRRDVVSHAITPAIDTKYATIYARVSTEDQGKGFSIPTQIEADQAMATRCTDN